MSDITALGIAVHFFPFSWMWRFWKADYGGTACIGPFRFSFYLSEPKERSK
jgi:hypothetical protein